MIISRMKHIWILSVKQLKLVHIYPNCINMYKYSININCYLSGYLLLMAPVYQIIFRQQKPWCLLKYMPHLFGQLSWVPITYISCTYSLVSGSMKSSIQEGTSFISHIFHVPMNIRIFLSGKKRSSSSGPRMEPLLVTLPTRKLL